VWAFYLAAVFQVGWIALAEARRCWRYRPR
jgi:hypothetical protein